MKKLLILTLLLPLSLSAVEISKIQSDPQSASRQKFIVNKKTITYEKESNLFDQAKDYRLGTFSSLNGKNTEELNRKLEGVLEQIKQTDLVLRSKGVSFNSLSQSRDHHQEFITIGEFKVIKDSNFYANLDKIFSELQEQDMILKNGIELSQDLKKISFYSNSKKVKEEDFNLKFVCSKEELPTVCRIKKEGYLFLSK